MLQIVAPRRPIIHRHSLRNSITTECVDQLILYSRCLLVQASLQTHDVARMIIQNREGVAPPLIQGLEPTLEIHLPELIGSFMLESLPLLVSLRFHRINRSVPLQYSVNRAVGGNLQLSAIHQNATDLSCSPTWVHRPDCKNLSFHFVFRSCRRLMRSSRSILQTRLPLPFPTFQPLVVRLRTHLKTSAQLTDVRSGLTTQAQNLFSKRHGLFHLAPGHSMTPPRIESPYPRCYPCLGTRV